MDRSSIDIHFSELQSVRAFVTSVYTVVIPYLLSLFLQQTFLISGLEGIQGVGVVQSSYSWTAARWGFSIPE